MRYWSTIRSLCVYGCILALVGIPFYARSAPIHTAVENGDRAGLDRILKEHPSSVNAQTAGGSTPLHLAVGMKDMELTKYLLDKGADVNIQTSEGYSPLHWAAFFNAGKIAELLIARGADTEIKTKNGMTPLQLALSESAQDVAAILVSKTKSAYVEPGIDDRYEQGANALRSGELDTAYRILNELVKQDPKNERVNFAYAMTCMAMKDFSRARLAFERILIVNPANHRARVELARAQAASQQFGPARANLEDVLKEKLDPKVRANIERFLKQIEKHGGQRHFSGRIDVGYFDDSNVNVGPDSEVINISPIVYGSLSLDELSLSADSMPMDSSGQFASLLASALWDVGDTAAWLAFCDFMVYNNWLEDADIYESRYLMFSAGGSRTFEKGTLRCPVRYSHIDSGGEPLVDMAGLAPVYSFFAEGGRLSFTTTGVLEMRNYTDLDDRDGFFVSAGQSVKMVANDGKASISMGLTVSHDETDAGFYTYNSVAWTLSVDQALPLGFITYARLASIKSGYDEKEDLSPEQREDSQRQFTVGLARPFGTRCGFDVNYQDTRNASSFGLYQYDRKVTTASVYYTF